MKYIEPIMLALAGTLLLWFAAWLSFTLLSVDVCAENGGIYHTSTWYFKMTCHYQ